MIRRLLLAVAISVAAITGVAQNESGSLDRIVTIANADCPMALDEGSSLDAVKLTADAVEIHMTLAIPAAQFPIIEQNMGMLRPTLLQMFTGDEDMKSVCRIASQNNVGLRIVISCRDDKSAHFSLYYTAKELADAVK